MDGGNKFCLGIIHPCSIVISTGVVGHISMFSMVDLLLFGFLCARLKFTLQQMDWSGEVNFFSTVRLFPLSVATSHYWCDYPISQPTSERRVRCGKPLDNVSKPNINRNGGRERW
jgi:hypothetical protein